MADLTITAANVIPGLNAKKSLGTAGVAVTAGQAVYLDPADDKYRRADNNSVTVAARAPAGIALHAPAAGQPRSVQTSGQITIGAALTAGVAYYLSGTPGGICPVADLVTGMYPTILGIATSTTGLALDIQPSGVAL